MKRLGVVVILCISVMTLLIACSWLKERSSSKDTLDGQLPQPVSLAELVAPGTFDSPVGLVRRAGEMDKVYIIDQPGRIYSVDLNNPETKPALVLDITDQVNDKGPEQGLLGLAFHPNRPAEAYVNYTTDTHTVIARYELDAEHPATLDPNSEQVLLTFEQPYANHNGGQLAFGPDGYLYIATGDGGSGGDPHNNGQNLQSLLGKILRIDVDHPSDGRAYGIPADNPFVGEGAAEIYAYGLRNPWRFSFDAETGQLWAADVGQNRFEEINIVEKGRNYGWRIQEGFECYDPAEGCDAAGLMPPLYVYGRDEGISVTGGYVYRGKQLSALTGWYVYGDYGSGTIWALRQGTDGQAENKTLLQSELRITSFGVDTGGELYVCADNGGIYKLVK